MLVKEPGDRLDDLDGAEHAGLDGVDRHVVTDRRQLLREELGGRGVDRAHPLGVLGHQGGDGGHRVPTGRGDGLGVGSSAGAPGGIRSRDGENARD